jgi:hypothetical protein
MSKAVQRGPLHRLTTLRDDPVTAWLGKSGAPSVAIVGWLNWAAYFVVMAVLARVLILSMGLFGRLIRRFIYLGLGAVGASLLPAMRRRVLRVRNSRLQTVVRAAAAGQALQIDDWEALKREPDGRVVSLVGWVSGHAQLSAPIGGESCIGIALGCQAHFPGVFESLHDFDLLDDAGRTVTIRVEGARLLGAPQVRLFGTDEARVLLGTLDLPVSATPTGDAYVLRDGDPVMVIGFKSTIAPESGGRAPARTVVTSGPPRPMLIYPIPAERREVVAVAM